MTRWEFGARKPLGWQTPGWVDARSSVQNSCPHVVKLGIVLNEQSSSSIFIQSTKWACELFDISSLYFLLHEQSSSSIFIQSTQWACELFNISSLDFLLNEQSSSSIFIQSTKCAIHWWSFKKWKSHWQKLQGVIHSEGTRNIIS